MQECALVIDGSTLVHALRSEFRQRFLQIASRCKVPLVSNLIVPPSFPSAPPPPPLDPLPAIVWRDRP